MPSDPRLFFTEISLPNASTPRKFIANNLPMLTTLRIKNLALVADLTLELQAGYNVITGETGAGKSIIIGALNLALGQRADRTLLRAGADHCSVEAVFEIRDLRAPLGQLLDENGLEPCEDGHLVIKRSFSSAGTNRQFVNGSPTTLNTLASLGDWLVDMHGPHEHQSLLQPARQLSILDAFGALEPRREEFSMRLRERSRVQAEKELLVVDDQTYARQLDLLRFQVQEIRGARLRPGEEEEVETDYRRATNSARLLELGQSALALLSENDSSILNQAGALGRALHELQRVDPAAHALVDSLELSLAGWRELQNDLSRYVDSIEIDPARLNELEERLNLLHGLRRKYGGTIADVVAFGEDAERKLAALEQRDTELTRLNARLHQLDRELLTLGQQLTLERQKLVPRLSKAVAKELRALGFAQSELDVSLVSRPELGAALLATGLDTVEFQFAPNPGEPARPLRAIASSGEMARVMLALKTVLAAEDDIPVLVFDEVDANVGGETANAVGEKMKQISHTHQVICITHLAPVAAQADAHFVVSKEVCDGRTLSKIELLNKGRRVEELARMLGGASSAARKHAEALLK